INIFNSWEANFMLIKSPNSLRRYVLTKDLLTSFEPGDLRKEEWVGVLEDPDTDENIYFAYKYTKDFLTREAVEYSIVFRLAEQYLIRAEAEAQLGQLQEAQADLNILRNRAGLPDTPAQNKEELLKAVLHERRVELFTENGQRWFDLKRTHHAAKVLSTIHPN